MCQYFYSIRNLFHTLRISNIFSFFFTFHSYVLPKHILARAAPPFLSSSLNWTLTNLQVHTRVLSLSYLLTIIKKHAQSIKEGFLYNSHYFYLVVVGGNG